MSDVLEHYDRASFSLDLQAMLAAAFPGDRLLSPADLAPLDQFHVRGLLATAELAERASIDRSTRVLDVGSGLGGPARYLAATYGARVTGVDLSPSLVAAARALSERTGVKDLVRFEVGDAAALGFADESFDCVTLYHVAMNVANREALYGGIRRVLAPGGRLVTYDVVRGGGGEVVYPVPWARRESASFLSTASQTLTMLETNGFRIASWTDETAIAIAWFANVASSPPPNGLSLPRLMGAEFASMGANFSRNLSEGRAAIVAVVADRG